jgi:hypothetical protein
MRPRAFAYCKFKFTEEKGLGDRPRMEKGFFFWGGGRREVFTCVDGYKGE